MKNFSTCPHSPLCPSCQLMEDPTSPPVYPEAKNYFNEKWNLDFPLYSGDLTRWRSKAKLAVRELEGKTSFGLFLPGTHTLIDSSNCIAHQEPIEKALDQLKELLAADSLPPYKENGEGLLRYVQMHVEREGERVQLGLVVTNKDKRVLEFLNKLKGNPLFHSLWLNINPHRTNRILGDEWVKIHGEEFLWQKILHNSFAFHPAAFSQANLPLFEKMLLSIKDSLPPSTKLLEMYAGNGIISLSLLDKCEKATLIEKNPYSYLSFQETMKRFPKVLKEKVSFHTSSIEDASFATDADTLIVDPPRKGLGDNLPKLISSLKEIERIVYVSCSFQSFALDAEKLERHGFSLKKAEGYLFFPGSDHLEILGVFEKGSG